MRGIVRGPGPIDPDGPGELVTTLFEHALVERFSDDAGCYVCNYAYYRALQSLPGKRVGFVHVPPVEVMPLDVQRSEMLRLIDAIESPVTSTPPLR